MIAPMAYDETLAARIRELVRDELDVSEKKMFGGLAYLASGHLAVAAGSQGRLMVRCDPDEADALVAREGVSRMVMRGRELHAWLLVEPRVLTDEALAEWVDIGLDLARSQPTG